jgi:hypothetical protein
MQVQYGRTVGVALMTLGILLLSLQLLLWVRIYAPKPSALSVPIQGPADAAPTKLPFLIGSIFVIGGIVLFSANLERPHEKPVRPGPKV